MDDVITDEATASAPSPVTLYESPESAAVALRGWAGTLASDNYVLGEDERYRLVADLRGAVAVLAEVQPHLTSSVPPRHPARLRGRGQRRRPLRPLVRHPGRRRRPGGVPPGRRAPVHAAPVRRIGPDLTHPSTNPDRR